MIDAAPLKRAILALPELSLRALWLKDQLGRADLATAARALNQLCEESEVADPQAREALLTLALLTIELAGTELLEQLRHQAAEQRLLSLERLVRRAPPAAHVAELKPEETRVPDYGSGRELTLGERRNLARRANRAAFDRLLADPHPRVIRELLTNPKLTEDDVVRLAARRPARAEILRQLARSPRWLRRSRVRLALLFNPGCPPELSIPLLGLCVRSELDELVHSPDTPVVLRATAFELLERRPPLAATESDVNLH